MDLPFDPREPIKFMMKELQVVDAVAGAHDVQG